MKKTDKLLSELFNHLKILNLLIGVYKREDIVSQKARIHIETFDISKMVSEQNHVEIFNELGKILELIYKEKQLSLLISDIAFFLALIDLYIIQFFRLDCQESIDAEERFFRHIDIARTHLGFFFKNKYPSRGGIQNTEQVAFLYSQHQDIIDKLEELGIDTRHYFEYDGTFQMYGSLGRMLVFNNYVAEIYALTAIEDIGRNILIGGINNSGEIADILLNQYKTQKLEKFNELFNEVSSPTLGEKGKEGYSESNKVRENKKHKTPSVYLSKETYFSTKGRIGRKKWWSLLIQFFAVQILTSIMSAALLPTIQNGGGPIWMLVILIPLLLMTYIMIAATIRRIHDVGHSGWLWLIPIYNPIVPAFFPGEKNDNKFGPKV